MSITIDRAIEILDPKHRECYDDLPDGMEQVQEACRMGQEALIRERDGKAARHGHWIEEDGIQICSECGEEHAFGEYRPSFCDTCGAEMDEGAQDDGI